MKAGSILLGELKKILSKARLFVTFDTVAKLLCGLGGIGFSTLLVRPERH